MIAKYLILLYAGSRRLTELRKMNDLLKRELGDLYLQNKELKKTLNGLESEEL